MLIEALQIFGLALLASVKFLYGPTAVYASGYTYFEALMITSGGGAVGVFMFFKAGEFISNWWKRRFPSKKPKKKFTRGNRVVVKIKARYGIYGLAFITPCIISIPIGCMIAARYYTGNRRVLPAMFLSVVFWSLVLSSITYLIGPVFA